MNVSYISQKDFWTIEDEIATNFTYMMKTGDTVYCEFDTSSDLGYKQLVARNHDSFPFLNDNQSFEAGYPLSLYRMRYLILAG